MDKFESMRAFVQVVEQEGFAAAARYMGMSRSAVNKLVINLENDLGVQLLHRTTRHVSPTETGRAFYSRCVGILADVAEAELSISQLHDEPRGVLRINAPLSFGTQHLSPAIATFMQQYPDLTVQLTLEDRFVDPIEEGYDLIIRIAQPKESPSLITQPLTPVRRVLCASPLYLKQRGIPLHPTDLRQHSCLHYGYLATGNQWKLLGTDGEHLIAVRGAFCSNNGDALCDAALHGLGIALLPTFIVGSALKEQRLQVVLPDYCPPVIEACILYPVNRHLSAKVTLFSEFLQARFGDRPPWDAGL
ncbi:MAG: LysR family transcriptional regulator [Elainellaceae cyanobacterium]